LRNAGDRTIPMFGVDDRMPAFASTAIASEPIAARGSSHYESVRKATKRGDHDGGSAIVTSSAPFGLVRTRRTLEVGGRLTVVPRWIDLRSFPLLEPSSSPAEILHERARTGAGEEYMGVREYRAGDPRRSVHWRTSARAGKLVVREFEETIVTRVALIVGGTDTGDPPDSAFESIASAAASIGLYALNTGHPVEMFTSTSAGVERLSSPGRSDILDRLARVEPSAWRPLEAADAALRAVQRHGTVVFCATSRGAPEAELRSAVRSVQAAGARAIAVIARSGSWETGEGSDEVDGGFGGRTIVRVLERGKELGTCLQGS